MDNNEALFPSVVDPDFKRQVHKEPETCRGGETSECRVTSHPETLTSSKQKKTPYFNTTHKDTSKCFHQSNTQSNILLFVNQAKHDTTLLICSSSSLFCYYCESQTSHQPLNVLYSNMTNVFFISISYGNVCVNKNCNNFQNKLKIYTGGSDEGREKSVQTS